MTITFTKSLAAKLAALFLLVALMPIAAISVLNYRSGKEAFEQQLYRSMRAVAHSKEMLIIHHVSEKRNILRALSMEPVLLEEMERFVASRESSSTAMSKYLLEEMHRIDRELGGIFVTNSAGVVIAATDPKQIGENKAADEFFTAGRNGLHTRDAYYSTFLDERAVGFSAPLHGKNGAFLGVIGTRYALKGLTDVAIIKSGIGASENSYILNKDGYALTDLPGMSDTFLKFKVDTEPVRLAQAKSQTMSGKYINYAGRQVIGASGGGDLKELMHGSWLILIELDTQEAFAPLAAMRRSALIAAVGALFAAMLVSLMLARAIARPVRTLSEATAKISAGDLTGDVPVSRNDEIGLLAAGFGRMLASLRDILTRTQRAVLQLTSASREIAAASQQQALGAREQSAAISETTSASKELCKSAEQVGHTIARVSQLASHALAGMGTINESIGKTDRLITALGQKSQTIGKIAQVIDDVADQTNLLAVNAAIEAARAGDQGRGFSVVADEMRKLADSTARSTGDITALIEEIQHEIATLVIAMEDNRNGVEDEMKTARETAERAKEIAMSANQQISASQQIAEAMVSIDDAMRQVTLGAEQSQNAALELSKLADELTGSVCGFKTA